MPTRFTILYVRLPGLLTLAASRTNPVNSSPRAVAQERLVRDACPIAAGAGVSVGDPISRARRLCPHLLVTPWEDIDPRTLAPLSHRFFDVLASLTATVEPDGPDATYADFAGGPQPRVEALTRRWQVLGSGFAPFIGFGSSRNAARACAECSLAPDHLPDANARWLWPEDPAVAARLHRLGLTTYGAVATLGESALVYQFGKLGRQLYARSAGHDFTQVRALYPPPQVRDERQFPLDPITDEGCLRHHLEHMAGSLSGSLRGQGRYARRLRLTVQTEREIDDVEWVLPTPVQAEAEINVSLRRLRQQITIAAPVVALAVEALDLDLPAATTGNLFDSRATERKLALAATRQKLRARYGTKALRRLSELPVPRRETRRQLRQEALHP